MNKTPLFVVALATLGFAGVPALASPVSSPAGGQPYTLTSTQHGSAGTVLAQDEEKPGGGDEQGKKSEDNDED